MRAHSLRPDFWRRVEQLALAYAVGLASLACALASLGGFSDGSTWEGGTITLGSAAVAVLTGLALVAARPGTSGRMAGAIIAGAGLAVPIAYVTDGATVPAALLFMALS